MSCASAVSWKKLGTIAFSTAARGAEMIKTLLDTQNAMVHTKCHGTHKMLLNTHKTPTSAQVARMGWAPSTMDVGVCCGVLHSICWVMSVECKQMKRVSDEREKHSSACKLALWANTPLVCVPLCTIIHIHHTQGVYDSGTVATMERVIECACELLCDPSHNAVVLSGCGTSGRLAFITSVSTHHPHTNCHAPTHHVPSHTVPSNSYPVDWWVCGFKQYASTKNY